jgi:ribonuclease P protein component
VDESGHWLGLVVPKRHAKRAVTRNLIKRQVRAAMVRHAPHLPGGLWVVRLRAPFDRQQFLSPGSDALRESAHGELAQLFERAASAPLPVDAPRRPRSRKA